jgi:hypothetical protein
VVRRLLGLGTLLAVAGALAKACATAANRNPAGGPATKTNGAPPQTVSYDYLSCCYDARMTSDGKQQFNVYLDPELVRATKRASLDRGQTLSDFVADILRAELRAPSQEGRQPRAGDLVPMPIMFVRDVRASLGLCRALGLRLRARSWNGRWAEVDTANGMLALHAVDDEADQRVALTFITHGQLEPLSARLKGAGFTVSDIIDEGYGRSMRVTDPNGLILQIDEQDPELST